VDKKGAEKRGCTNASVAPSCAYANTMAGILMATKFIVYRSCTMLRCQMFNLLTVWARDIKRDGMNELVGSVQGSRWNGVHRRTDDTFLF